MRAAAEEHWPPDTPPIRDPLSLTIIYFYEGTPLDVDNVPKPILDGFKGVVYDNDDQITDIICRRRDIASRLRIPDVSEVLAEGIERDTEFLYIVIDDAPKYEVMI